MTIFNKALLGLCCATLIVFSNEAFANEPTNTYTSLRCYYRTDPSNNANPNFSWEWALSLNKIEENRYIAPAIHVNTRSPADADLVVPAIDKSKNPSAKSVASTNYYRLRGYWSSTTGVLANLFYTDTSEKDLVDICKSSLVLQGIKKPFVMYAASDYDIATDYMIWINDPTAADQGNKINKIISFGDSISDTHNMFSGTNGVLPNGKNLLPSAMNDYYLGRFSNGKNWIDYLSEALNVPAYNWAIGGVGSRDQYGVLKGVIYQVGSWAYYTKTNFAKNYQPKNTLFTLLIGANDLISFNNDKTRGGKEIAIDVKTALQSLIDNGAKNILLVKLPDISRAPLFKLDAKKDDRAWVQEQVKIYGDYLATYAQKTSDLNIQVFDAYTLVNDMFTNPGNYGLNNVVDSCLSLYDNSVSNYTLYRNRRPQCSKSEQTDTYLFWDLLHPTTRAHKILSDKAFCFIQRNFGESLNPPSGNTPLCELTQPATSN